MKNISNKKVVIATHYLIYGPAQALKDYLINQKNNKLLFISHPLKMDMGEESFSYYEIFDKGVAKKEYKKVRKNKNFILKCFWDLFLVFRWVGKSKERFDLFVGSNNLNALAGIILREMGYTKKVVFYTGDYYPQRFKNRFLNFIYYRLDKFCVKYSDETWNFTPAMAEARAKKVGLISKEQKTVPAGVWFKRVHRKPFNVIKKTKLVYVGQLMKELGVDLVIRSIPKIIKEIPDFKFLLIGGGEEYENIKNLTKKMGLENYVTFTGWIKDRITLENLMLDSAIGIAPFNTEILDEKVYNADPAKVKDYMLLGMPVILTDATRIARKLEKAKCGVIIDYNEDSLARAVIDLMKNEEKLQKYRENAVEYIKNYDWDLIFGENLRRVVGE